MALSILMRKIHRIFVLVIIVVGLIFILTGLEMKYFFLDPAMARFIHNNLSPVIAAVLFVMIITGAYMYFYPWFAKRKMKKQAETKP